MSDEPSIQPPSLSVSIVVYRADLRVLRNTLNTLQQAIVQAQKAAVLGAVSIELINNGDACPALTDVLQTQEIAPAQNLRLLEGHGNLGYGRGHNLSILPSRADFHLILNPDVLLSPDALLQGVRFLQEHAAVVAVSPAVSNADGSKQYACKRYPSVCDFLLRGFAPASVKARFSRRLAHYEMRDLPEDHASTAIPIISGCCMLFRTPALHALQGFEPAYFLYFEDFDLSLRAHEQGELAYLPNMRIQHLGGHSARKGLRHIGFFVRSGVRFYNTHGWRFL